MQSLVPLVLFILVLCGCGGGTANTPVSLNAAVVGLGARASVTDTLYWGDHLTWLACSAESDTCSFTGSKLVRFGARGSYVMKELTGGTPCSTEAFGVDPAPWVRKTCDTAEGSTIGSTWQRCGVEGAQCVFTGSHDVMFGVAGRNVFAIRTAADGISCSDAGFGFDPVPFARKTCAVFTTTVQSAIRSGCRTKANIDALVTQTLSRPDLGEMTRAKLTEFSRRGDWATFAVVTDSDTWGYRAATILGEVNKLKQGRLTSKSARQLSRWSGPVAEFWASYGPDMSAPQHDATSLSLQMLATSSSDEPPSQFVSVALDYSVASGFGDPVYRFQLNPQSPVLGLSNCQKVGEVQIQPPGGTPIRNLQRFDRTKGYWEKYQAGVWVQIGGLDPQPPN